MGTLATLLAAIVLLAACRETRTDRDAVRADAKLYQQLREDAAADLHPPGARRVRAYEDAACRGDSGSGPQIIRGYDWDGEPKDLLSFYRSQVEGLGWQFVRSESVASSEGDYELFLWDKAMAGYPVTLEVRTVRFRESDFDVILRAEPRQECA